jgi:methylase of polypeptide subunit release factors
MNNGNKPAFDSNDDYKRARDLLESADYTTEGMRRALGFDKKAVPTTGDPLLLRRTTGGTPLDTLLRLFFICVPVDIDAARRALQPMSLEVWENAGVIERREGSVSSRFRLSRFKDLILVHDFRPASGQTGSDFVMGIGGATRTQAMTTVRRQCGRALDVGTGSGILALLASRHCGEVYGVDPNPRAIAVARFNARLNEIENVHFREGKFLEPVAGLDFDLIVADPPFVISPPTDLLYLDGGMRGDEFCRLLAHDTSRQLREGGYFQMLLNWPHYRGRDAAGELKSWFQGIGCDAWVLRVNTEEAPAYANSWVEHIYGRDRQAAGRMFNQWMDYYEAQGIEAMSLGVATLRRCTNRANWFSLEDAPPAVTDECGEDIELLFANRDFSARHDNDALLDATLRCAPQVRLEYRCEPEGSEWRMASSELRLDKALRFSSKADPFTAGLLVRCDGRTKLRSLLPELATAAGVNLQNIEAACLHSVRQMLERGFLLPG